MKDNPIVRALIASLIALIGAYVLMYAIDRQSSIRAWNSIHVPKGEPQRQVGFDWPFYSALVLIGASGGSLWRRPLIGAGCGAVAVVVIAHVAVFVYFVTHWIPLL